MKKVIFSTLTFVVLVAITAFYPEKPILVDYDSEVVATMTTPSTQLAYGQSRFHVDLSLAPCCDPTTDTGRTKFYSISDLSIVENYTPSGWVDVVGYDDGVCSGGWDNNPITTQSQTLVINWKNRTGEDVVVTIVVDDYNGSRETFYVTVQYDPYW